MNKLYKSYAKINLGLEILRKRIDGYHEINSVFLPITLNDEIIFQFSNNFTISIEPENIEIPLQENLIYKTINLIQNKYKINTNQINVHLRKKIPLGAGLGGGSSNAATTINAIDEIYNLNLSLKEKIEIANQIGADVPFFINPLPSVVQGKGEIIEPIDFPFTFEIVLVVPNISISTKFAYSKVVILNNKKATDFKSILTQIKSIDEFKYVFHNDFEDYLFPEFPELREIKEKLIDCGANFASLSGSGSVVYGLFEKDIDKQLLIKNFENQKIIFAEPITTINQFTK